MVKKRGSFISHAKKKYIIFCFLCIIAFLSWECGQIKKTSLKYLDQHGTVHTLSLSVKDKKKLFYFMQELFAGDNFAYTILGSKPLSWATYHNPFPFTKGTTFRDALSKYNRTLHSGWKTWEKYRPLFPSANLWAEKSPCYPASISILLVNEASFNTVVHNHKKDFQEVLGREVLDGFQLLREAKKDSLINGTLKGHQALIGIVLGYGKNNSWKFLEACEKRNPLGWVWDEVEYPGHDEKIIEKIPLTELYLSLYSCPSFSGEPNSEESLALKRDYLLTRQKVLNYYKDKDFLEATLSLLAGYRPQEL